MRMVMVVKAEPWTCLKKNFNLETGEIKFVLPLN